jgi:hypothetical protein
MFEPGHDQASGLRRLFKPRALRLLPVAVDPQPSVSAAFALNLAAALVRSGWNPIVLDAHRQGVGSLFGLDSGYELDDLMAGRCSFSQAMRRSPEGVAVLMARRGLGSIAADPRTAEAVFSALASLSGAFDVALLHAPAATLGALLCEQEAETALLCGPDDRDLTDTYARLKSMVNDHHLSRFRVVFDGTHSPADAASRHRRLAAAAARFLDVSVLFGGSMGKGADRDAAVRDRRSVFSVAADGPAARAFERIASAAHDWRMPAFTPDLRTIH